MSIKSFYAVTAALVLAAVCNAGSTEDTSKRAWAQAATAQTTVAAGSGIRLDTPLTNVSISGRIRTENGRPISKARIILRDADTNEVVATALSSTFGYYKLEQVESGRMYVLSVVHKRYLFAFPAQLMELNEDRTGVDFVGEMEN